MTDERLCAACGHVEYWHGEGSVPLPHPKSGPACARCMGQNDVDPWHDFSPPEAAPSTDEGEARWERTDGTIGDNVSVWNLDGRYWGVVPRSLEDAIRTPLEERIRELEALLGTTTAARAWSGIRERAEHAEAENERLREALDAIGWHVLPESPIGRIVHNSLATSPSSTEGTE